MGQITRMLTLVDGTIERDFLGCALKIAFATSDQHHIDQHFGTCESLAIFMVTGEQVHFHQSIAFEKAEKDGAEGKLQVRIDALEGCAAVYCRAVGAAAIAQIRQIGVQPIKTADGMPIKQQLNQLQEDLKNEPPLWMVRALETVKGIRGDAQRFDEMENEGWNE
ncbi:NifB/NifX family molybdenum-iron cluster-binding protein [uncultured Cohaesibacter sp.]|uniref:NifB/NifX family molybdenum-iron cluster-binding protein n=1 Tax=uncultured Cohaesibacter sp. TaxID=1002546 RepID=UPI00292D4ED8|nr:NifB/NifX family molybdenum-iron cluster-binding protein [uncultured Cohaesibacter sp.]